MSTHLTIFEDYNIRRVYDEKKDVWHFSIVDIVQALTQQKDFQTARKYWNKLKERLNTEGSQVVTNCHQFIRKIEKEMDGYLKLLNIS